MQNAIPRDCEHRRLFLQPASRIHTRRELFGMLGSVTIPSILVCLSLVGDAHSCLCAPRLPESGSLPYFSCVHNSNALGNWAIVAQVKELDSFSSGMMVSEFSTFWKHRGDSRKL